MHHVFLLAGHRIYFLILLQNEVVVIALLNEATGNHYHLSSNIWLHWKLLLLLLSSFSRVQLFATPWTAAYQAPLSMGFSRQEYWSRVPLPSMESWWVAFKCPELALVHAVSPHNSAFIILLKDSKLPHKIKSLRFKIVFLPSVKSLTLYNYSHKHYRKLLTILIGILAQII